MPLYPVASTIVGSGGVSLSTQGKTITISGSNQVMSAWDPFPNPGVSASAVSSHAAGTYFFHRVFLPNPLVISNVNLVKSYSAVAPTGTSTNSSGTNVYSYAHTLAIFRRQDFGANSSNISYVTSASFGMTAAHTYTSSTAQSYAISWVTNSTGGTSSFSTSTSNSSWATAVTGLKVWKMPLVATLSAGEYFFAHQHSTTRASTGQSGSILAMNNLHFVPQVGGTVGTIGSSGIAFSGIQGAGQGVASAITTNATMAISVVSAGTQQLQYFNLSNA
jgi:hypothetical protein